MAQHAISEVNFVLLRRRQRLHYIEKIALLTSFIFSRSAFYGTMHFSLSCFHHSPPSIFTRNKTFCHHRGLRRVFDAMLLTGDIFSKLPETNVANFPPFYHFLRIFRLRKTTSPVLRVASDYFSVSWN